MIKPKYSLLLLAFALPAFLSFDGASLLNKPMPILPGTTLNGKTVDAGYYKGHITLVTFMYIGCPPCMNEIDALNRLKRELGSNGRFQLLCIARQMPSQMLNFSGRNKSTVSEMRRSQGADSIQYDILPACPEGVSKMDSTVTVTKTKKGIDTAVNISLHSECEVIEQAFGITSYPSMFFVDEKGVIRKITHGGPVTNKDDAFYRGLKAEVDSMLQR